MTKLTSSQIYKLAHKVVALWKSQNLIEFKTTEDEVVKVITSAVQQELKLEDDLEKEVFKMLDEMEISQGESFERGKMFKLLKQRLAKERKIVL